MRTVTIAMKEDFPNHPMTKFYHNAIGRLVMWALEGYDTVEILGIGGL